MTDPNSPPDQTHDTPPLLPPQARRAVARAARWWWVFLVTAVLWVVIAIIALQFTTESLAVVGLMIGGMLLFAGFEQFVAASVADGMRWLFWIFGVLFIVVGVVALFNPLTTATSVAGSLGVIFALIGLFWIIEAIADRTVNPLWWLGLLSAVVMVGLAIWLGTQTLAEKAVSLLVFAGFWALLHAVTDIIRAFRLKKAGDLVSRTAA